MIKAIIFDFGQTLVNSANGFRAAEKDAQEKLFAALSLALRKDFLTVYRKFRREFHERSNFSRVALWQEVFHYYCMEPDVKLLEAWETEYWQTVKAHTVLFPEAEEVLEALCGRYKVALITNTQGQRSEGTHRIALFPQLEHFFKVIVVAGENGIPPKPDPQPFRLCLQQLGLAAADAVYVGDDWRIDICGARDAGLHAVWLKHHSVRRNWPEVQTSIPVITNLKELLDMHGVQTG